MKTKTKMSLSAYSVQRDPEESSLCSLRPEGVNEIYGASPSWPLAALCLGVVARSREEFQHCCPCDGLHLISLTTLSQKSAETSDCVDPDVVCMVPKELPCSLGYLGL